MLKTVEKDAEKLETDFFATFYEELPVFDFEIN